MFSALRSSLLSLIYPQECRVCQGPANNIAYGVACGDCWADTRIFTGAEMLCGKCGAYFGEIAAPKSVYCHKCDLHHYDQAGAIGIYEKALAASILHLKKVPVLSKELRRLTTSATGMSVFKDIDLLIPIPLSKRRRLERDFNQAEIIAGPIARSLGLPLDTKSLTRKIHTPMHRVGMDQKARELSVRNAFEVKRPKLIDGKKILLIDDVLTSGATASFAAKALKKSGAAKVNVFTLARAVMN